ncbi:hypothetical protein SAMN05444483_11630 [Salegentibacter echinorum]|uniref:DUF3108 domain-containing protein n=1 Tax=Salegentibacter echinorum TaxID=1073325 RepID=A0A1M5KSS2_SALEC|nr:hypothetical protein [Salegentibacter echinorum]SHG55817.1 hypothetical protein SAMN05444483_11630 [Salegentibacter echinorum]
MKKLLLLLIFIAFNLNAQQRETVNLKWKISDTLTYKTVMKDVIFEKSNEQDEKDSLSKGMSGMFNAMKKQLSNLKYETKLYPDKSGNIDIAMMLKKVEADTTGSIFPVMAAMNGNVVLRGKISPEGEMLSFYYKRAQKNIISVLFELPTKPVKIGDEWNLQVDMIAVDQTFKPDSIYRKNLVRLKDIKMKNGKKIAIIEYDIEEFVSGDIENKMMSMFSKDKTDKKTFMKMSHKATAEFDLQKGYWISYEGNMNVETNISIMGIGVNKRTEFKLTPEK